MLFNSVVFIQFFAAFLLLYFLVRHNLRARNLLVVTASYLFYGWWDYRFLALLFASSVLDYFVGLAMQRSSDRTQRRIWLSFSLAGNLGILGFFKYYGFFVDSFVTLLTRLGFSTHIPLWQIVLPVGISFYTFQTLSYALDVYRGHVLPTRDFIQFLAYVSFFPQLVAGPIERANHLLPQFAVERVITREDLAEGYWLALWGMFKKVVIADNLAPLVDLAYQTPTNSGALVMLGTIAFAVQIYCDFSGYSDIARGIARWLGFDLMMNFNLPYLADSVRNFWRRWHISLSTWLRDYLYFSLGGNRRGRARTHLNLLITMILGGLWHGAAWHFLLWGAWHGVGLVVNRWWTDASQSRAVSLPRIVGWAMTLLFVLYGWLLFRANSLDQVLSMTRALGNFSGPDWIGHYALSVGIWSLPLILMQTWQAYTGNLLVPLTLRAPTKLGLQAALLLGILIFWRTDSTPFIYFQF